MWLESWRERDEDANWLVVWLVAIDVCGHAHALMNSPRLKAVHVAVASDGLLAECCTLAVETRGGRGPLGLIGPLIRLVSCIPSDGLCTVPRCPR